MNTSLFTNTMLKFALDPDGVRTTTGEKLWLPDRAIDAEPETPVA